MKNCEAVLQHYLESFSDSFKIRESGDFCIIQTPFRFLDNEPIKFYVKQQGEGYLISDRGVIEGYWFREGLNVETSIRAANIIRSIIHLYGITWKGEEFFTKSAQSELGLSIHSFLQAMIRLSDLDYVIPASPRMLSFRDKVEGFLVEEGVDVEAGVSIAGRSAMHSIDLVANGRPTPAYIEALTAADAYDAFIESKASAFKYIDIRAYEEQSFVGIMVLDDALDVWRDRTLSVVREYSDAYTFWSERSILLDYLVNP